MFKDVNDRNNKREITNCRKVSQIEGEQDVGFMVWRHHMVLDEDQALIGTFGNEEEEYQLYISYNSDSYERNDHNGANNSLLYILSNVM